MKEFYFIVPLATGFEEMEAVGIVDVLRRGGIHVITASTGNDKLVIGSRGIGIVADMVWDDAVNLKDYDGIAIPGGIGGTRKNQADERVLAKVRELYANGKITAAICAGPLVLQSAGVLTSATAVTCYPGLEAELPVSVFTMKRVVTDGCVITSQGPGTVYEFALEILRRTRCDAVADAVAKGMIFQ